VTLIRVIATLADLYTIAGRLQDINVFGPPNCHFWLTNITADQHLSSNCSVTTCKRCSVTNANRIKDYDSKLVKLICNGKAALRAFMRCAAEVAQKEGTKLASRQEFAKRVALDLFR